MRIYQALSVVDASSENRRLTDWSETPSVEIVTRECDGYDVPARSHRDVEQSVTKSAALCSSMESMSRSKPVRTYC